MLEARFRRIEVPEYEIDVSSKGFGPGDERGHASFVGFANCFVQEMDGVFDLSPQKVKAS